MHQICQKGRAAVQRQNRLSQNRQFSYVYRRGRKVSCREMSLLFVRSKERRIGFSVSKKVGVAVVRNRTKRRLRETVRPLLPQLKSGLYVFVARPNAAQLTFQELGSRVRYLLRKAECLRAAEGANAHRPSAGKPEPQPEEGVSTNSPE